MSLTFGELFHCVLQVLHDGFLPDQLLDSSLGLGVERIVDEPGDLPLSRVRRGLPLLQLVPDLPETSCIIHRSRELGIPPLDVCPSLRVSQDLQPDHLRVRPASAA